MFPERTGRNQSSPLARDQSRNAGYVSLVDVSRPVRIAHRAAIATAFSVVPEPAFGEANRRRACRDYGLPPDGVPGN